MIDKWWYHEYDYYFSNYISIMDYFDFIGYVSYITFHLLHAFNSILCAFSCID